eukprot:2591369-Amphidinium_carterae.1
MVCSLLLDAGLVKKAAGRGATESDGESEAPRWSSACFPGRQQRETCLQSSVSGRHANADQNQEPLGLISMFDFREASVHNTVCVRETGLLTCSIDSCFGHGSARQEFIKESGQESQLPCEAVQATL